MITYYYEFAGAKLFLLLLLLLHHQHLPFLLTGKKERTCLERGEREKKSICGLFIKGGEGRFMAQPTDSPTNHSKFQLSTEKSAPSFSGAKCKVYVPTELPSCTPPLLVGTTKAAQDVTQNLAQYVSICLVYVVVVRQNFLCAECWSGVSSFFRFYIHICFE